MANHGRSAFAVSLNARRIYYGYTTNTDRIQMTTDEYSCYGDVTVMLRAVTAIFWRCHINHPCQRTNRPRNRTRLDPFFWATLYRLVHYLCPLYRQDCGYSTTCNSSLSELFSHPLEQFHPIPRNPSSPRFGSSSFPCPLYVIFSHPSVPSSVPLSPIGSPY